MGRFVAILVTCVILVGGVTLLSMNRTSANLMDSGIAQFHRAVAHSHAVSNANMAISALLLGEDMSEFSGAQLFDGFVSLDTLRLADSLIKIVSRGFASQGDTAMVQAIVDLRKIGLTYTTRAAIIAPCSLGTSERVVVDGRDHDLAGNVRPLTGTLAISTERTFRRQSQSKIGGTFQAWDYQPAVAYLSSLVEESAQWQGGFPDTPEKLFAGHEASYSEGFLIDIAKGGAGGSQYVTDPASLRWPLKSLTYVELPPGGQWMNVDFQESSGILVVHNSSATAQLKYVKQGRFTGVLIADEFDALDGQVIGSVAVLARSLNRFGGRGEILFSRESIAQAVSALQEQVPKRSVVSWYE